MSAALTSFGRELMLTALLRPDAFTALGTLQVALTLSVPPSSAVAAQLLEPTTGGYARASYGASAAQWTTTGYGELYNALPIVFPQVGASWGLIQGLALVDPVSASAVAVGSLSPYFATTGMVPELPAGALVLGLYDAP